MRARPGIALALMLMATLVLAQGGAHAPAPEYQVKAAFIYKFATYIRWPARSGQEDGTPFVIGVLGKDPFGPALDQVVHGQSVLGRPIDIRRLARVEDALHCDVLFVSSSEREHLAEILVVLRGAPILTVSDMDQFAERGGMINLVTIEANQIRFDINKQAIDRSRLKAPSQLLRLARMVESRSDAR